MTSSFEGCSLWSVLRFRHSWTPSTAPPFDFSWIRLYWRYSVRTLQISLVSRWLPTSNHEGSHHPPIQTKLMRWRQICCVDEIPPLKSSGIFTCISTMLPLHDQRTKQMPVTRVDSWFLRAIHGFVSPFGWFESERPTFIYYDLI